MMTLTIDNKTVRSRSGNTLLQIAKKNNINIPTLCYHERISPTGACRLCIVKIKGRNGLITSCTTAGEDGMKVVAFDDELEEARMYLLRCLLSEYDDSCHDLSYRNELKELATKYNFNDFNGPKLVSLWKNLNRPTDATSPVLTHEASKCIKCFRCIKACEEIQGKNVLSFADRGLNKYIVAGLGVWSESECDGCGECVQLCPTGSIVEKPNRSLLKASMFDFSVQSTCPYCGVGCRIEIKAKDNRIVRINGLEGVKPNDGRLCVKGRFGYEFVNSNKRLTKPLIKHNGRIEEVDWNEAINFIAYKFNNIKKRFGNNSLAGYSSAKCTNEDNYIFQKFIRIVFGTNNIDYCTRLCHASTVTAMIETLGSGAGLNSIEDYETADCIVIIGNNMVETHPVTATFVKRGVLNGAKLIIIDPKWTPLVKHADVWLQPKLGTDIALINGMIKIVIDEDLIDTDFINSRIRGGLEALHNLKDSVNEYNVEKVKKITDVGPNMLLRASRLCATSNKVMVATGMGISQQLNGTDIVFSVLNLCLITGGIGKEGSGLNPPRGQNNVQGASDIGCIPMSYPGYISVTDSNNRKKLAQLWNVPYSSLPNKPGLTTVEIIKAAYTGEIKGMYVMGENPMLSDPNLNHTEQALKNLDFLLVQDIFFTETAQHADVILPAASFAEKNGTFISSDRRVSRVRKAISSPGTARQDWMILSALAKKMGHSIGDYDYESDIFDEIATVTPMLAGLNYNRIGTEGVQWPCLSENDAGTRTLFTDKFNTSDGLASLNPVKFKCQSKDTHGKYPFLLNTGRILYHYHTGTMSRKSTSLTGYENSSYLLMNSGDANELDLSNGELIKVTSEQGELKTTLRISNEVKIGELFMPFHYSESPVNRLTRDELDPYSKIPAFKRTACRIEKVTA